MIGSKRTEMISKGDDCQPRLVEIKLLNRTLWAWVTREDEQRLARSSAGFHDHQGEGKRDASRQHR
jgi:hypothetical protein